MSDPTDPTDPGTPPIRAETRHALRRRGRVFGFDYDVDVRITALVDPDEETVRPPLLPAASRILPPADDGG